MWLLKGLLLTALMAIAYGLYNQEMAFQDEIAGKDDGGRLIPPNSPLWNRPNPNDFPEHVQLHVAEYVDENSKESHSSEYKSDSNNWSGSSHHSSSSSSEDSLSYNHHRRRYCFRCGGTIIKQRWIITAASCLWIVSGDKMPYLINDPDDVLYVAGKTRLKRGKYHRVRPSTATSISNVIVHIEFTFNPLGGKFVHDIALLKTQENILVNGQTITPIAYASSAYSGSPKYLVFAGYGADDNRNSRPSRRLNAMWNVTTITDSACNVSYSHSGNWLVPLHGTICTKTAFNVGYCSFDGGSGLLNQNITTPPRKLIGIASWVDNCEKSTFTVNQPCPPIIANTFTDVGYYSKWIDNIVGSGP